MYYINMNMNIRNYVFIFLIGVIYYTISMIQPCSVLASEAIFDEIENFVAPPAAEEMQINEPEQENISEPEQTDVEETDSLNSGEQAEEEDTTIQNTEPVKEKASVPVKETNNEPEQKDIKVQTTQTTEDNTVKTVSEEEPVTEKNPKVNYLSMSEFFNKCRDFFSCLSLDKINTLKDTVIQQIIPSRYACTSCCKPFNENKQVVNKKDFLPYYFLYHKPINKHLEKIVFTDNIANPTDFFTYTYAISNYETKIEAPKNAVTPQGTTDIRVLVNAPSPEIKVVGEALFAKIVIDIANNTLYKYDEDGFPLKAYLVATGARGTRTMAGLRVVSYMEKFPYRGAPKDCKRLFDPYSYGPYILFLNRVNPKTGRQSYVDQFLHGNGNERSIGRKVSHGCVRTNNNVMRNELSKEVKRGDYVLLINPDRN